MVWSRERYVAFRTLISKLTDMKRAWGPGDQLQVSFSRLNNNEVIMTTPK